MSPSQTPHPAASDLANLAQEKLGRKKTERILDHCKECPQCAERLLEAVRAQPFGPERVVLSTWNWISIGILIVALAAVVAVMLWLLRGVSQRGGVDEAFQAVGETVHSEAPDSWFEALFAHAIVSPAGDTMIRVDGLEVRMLDLQTGTDLRSRLWLDFDGIMGATFDGNGTLARFANKRRDLGWFIDRDGEPWLTSLPPGAVPVWAPGNADVVWTRPPGTRLFLGYPPNQRTYDGNGRVLGLAWAPAADAAYALVMAEEGATSLLRIRRANSRPETIRADLDASALPNGLAISPDGEAIFVALASRGSPEGVARHRPEADRDLDIYRVDAGSGDLRAVVTTPGDDFWPWVAGGDLYWTHNESRASVVILPLDRGALPAHGDPGPTSVAGRDVGDTDAQLPSWSPDGTRLAFTRGSWRVADWGLSFDIATVALSGTGTAAGDAQPLVSGYHADLTPVWSPDGRWLAYRSRRSPEPVPYYAGPGVVDDIFLRSAAGGTEQERRLTDFGWEAGGPSWAPDSRRLVFDSWDRGGVPRVARPWIVSIDPQTGESTGSEQLQLPPQVSGSISAVWSPVADEMLLIERRDPESQTLWVLRLADGRAERVADFASRTHGGADWTPDGSRIVYAASVDGRMQLFVVGKEGGEARRLTDGPANVLHPRVSPDGQWVAATKLVQRKEIRRLPLRLID